MPKLRAAVGAAFMMTSWHAVTVAAQDSAGGTPQAVDSGDIVVTARRREESLQSVPLSITAVSGDMLKSVGVRQIDDVVNVAPSLRSVGNGGRRDALIFTLRGINAAGVTLPQDPGIAVYSDEIIYARPYGLTGAMIDLENVQILYGPQGTLFGRNSTAGAILLSSKKPNLSLYEGEVSFAVGNYDRREFTAIANVPIVEDQLALRVAGKRRKVDGFTHVIYADPVFKKSFARADDWADDVDDWYIRASLRFEPGDGRFSNIVTYDYFKSDTVGTGQILVAARPVGVLDQYRLDVTTAAGAPVSAFSGGAAFASQRWAGGPTAATGLGFPSYQSLLARQKTLGIRTRYADEQLSSNQKVTGIGNVTTFELSDTLTVKNVIGYRKYVIDQSVDLDGTELPQQYGDYYANFRHWSEELQFQGKLLNNQLSWILGGYYFNEKGADIVGGTNSGSRVVMFTSGHGQNLSKSVFGQVYFTPDGLDKLTLTLGGRYTWDKRSYTWTHRTGSACRVLNDAGAVLPSGACALTRTTKFSDPTYNISLDYRWSPDVMTYIAHRRGYRSGGFNARAVNLAQRVPFDSERIEDYEIGLKAKFKLGTVPARFNIAAYKAKNRGFQANALTLDRGVVATNIVNAGAATIKGGEAELAFGPVAGFELSLNGAMADFTFDRFDTVVVPTSGPRTGLPTPITLRDLPGYNSKYSWGATLSHGAKLSFADVRSAFSYSWKSRARSGLAIPFSESPEGDLPAAGLANASVRLEDIGGSPVFVNANVSNLFNTDKLQSNLSLQGSLGFTTGYYTPPRMWTLEVGARF